MKTTSPDEEPSVIEVAPREGRTIWDALRSIIRSIDDLPSSYVLQTIEILFNHSMAPEVLKSLKQIHPKLKLQNVRKLIAALIYRLEKFSSEPDFDPRMN